MVTVQNRNHQKFQIFKRDQQSKVTADFYNAADFTLKLFLAQAGTSRIFSSQLTAAAFICSRSPFNLSLYTTTCRILVSPLYLSAILQNRHQT
jgi:hypothetical protein